MSAHNEGKAQLKIETFIPPGRRDVRKGKMKWLRPKNKTWLIKGLKPVIQNSIAVLKIENDFYVYQ